MLYTVEVRRIGADLAASMVEMRTWLDHHGINPLFSNIRLAVLAPPSGFGSIKKAMRWLSRPPSAAGSIMASTPMGPTFGICHRLEQDRFCPTGVSRG